MHIVLSTFIMSRPYNRDVRVEEKYTRDIFLCIDISSSVDGLNVNIISNLKDVVSNMQGERFGLVIFNTSPVLLVPLTNDYEYILDELDRVEEHIKKRMHDYWSADEEYIEEGYVSDVAYQWTILSDDIDKHISDSFVITYSKLFNNTLFLLLHNMEIFY